MGVISVQTSFRRGEIAPGARGNLGTEMYQQALAECRNWQPTPLGSLLMRAGTQRVDGLPAPARLIPFRAARTADDYVLALNDHELRVYSRATGALVGIRVPALVKHFETGYGSWVQSWAETPGAIVNEAAEVPYNTTLTETANNLVVGHTYRFMVGVSCTEQIANVLELSLKLLGGLGPVAAPVIFSLSQKKEVLSIDVVATEEDHVVQVHHLVAGAVGAKIRVEWAALYDLDAATVPSIFSAIGAENLSAVHFDGEPVKNRTALVGLHGLTFVSMLPESIWEVRGMELIGTPPQWNVGNYPSTVEVGFQGRTWLGATPNEPGTIWFSKSGAPLDFTAGANPGDASSFIVSAKGALRWLRGQKALLAGSEVVEHAITGSQRLIAPADINVEDESAFGSAPIQAIHIGDQLLWVTRDLRHVRSLEYELQRSAWVSRAVTFLAAHLTVGGLAELAFVRAPVPTIFARRSDGVVVAATYDRSENIIAWWRVQLAGDAVVHSMCVADGPNGGELWMSVARANGEQLERLPMHEVSVGYLDSAVTVVAAGGVLAGLEHLEGEEVTMVAAGAIVGSGAVAGGEIPCEVDDGTSVTVGLGYTARAKTLPRTLTTGKLRNPKVGALLNDSAIPLLNGKRAADRTPSTPQDQVEPGLTGRVVVANLGWSKDAAVTIEQDLPVRTEVLALVAVTQAKRA